MASQALPEGRRVNVKMAIAHNKTTARLPVRLSRRWLDSPLDATQRMIAAVSPSKDTPMP